MDTEFEYCSTTRRTKSATQLPAPNENRSAEECCRGLCKKWCPAIVLMWKPVPSCDINNSRIAHYRAGHMQMSLSWHFKVEYRGLQAANHPAASVNQNVTLNILCENCRQKLLCFPQKLKHSNRMVDWWIPTKAFTVRNGVGLLMMRDTSCSQMEQITFTWKLESDIPTSVHCPKWRSNPKLVGKRQG